WAGDSWEDAARLWSSIYSRVGQLPPERTIVVSYDALAAHPVATLAALHDALAQVGLDPERFDPAMLAVSHAAIVDKPPPTIATLADDGQVTLTPIASVDVDRWTADVHARVWPLVAETHRRLGQRLGAVYVAPPRPTRVSDEQW